MLHPEAINCAVKFIRVYLGALIACVDVLTEITPPSLPPSKIMSSVIISGYKIDQALYDLHDNENVTHHQQLGVLHLMWGNSLEKKWILKLANEIWTTKIRNLRLVWVCW